MIVPVGAMGVPVMVVSVTNTRHVVATLTASGFGEHPMVTASLRWVTVIDVVPEFAIWSRSPGKLALIVVVPSVPGAGVYVTEHCAE